MKKLRTLTALLPLFAILSCSKEYSNENGNPTNNCRISSIAEAADALTSSGIYALNTKFGAGNLASGVEAYDSTTNTADFTISFSYKGDTVFTTGNDFFVLDASKKVKKLFTPLDPSDPLGQIVVYEYKYDASNYLVEKTISAAGIPLALVTFKYTWVAGNLTKVTGVVNTGLTTEKLLEANMEYDLTKQPRNFMYIFPDGFENFFYLNAMDFGKKPTNLIKKISVVYFDDQGVSQGNFNTFISDVKFNPDGYVTEWYADGSSIDPTGIFLGRTLFGYKCN
jgi:hypothetical protein